MELKFWFFAQLQKLIRSPAANWKKKPVAFFGKHAVSLWLVRRVIRKQEEAHMRNSLRPCSSLG